jgi:hypothetical protein
MIRDFPLCVFVVYEWIELIFTNSLTNNLGGFTMCNFMLC